MLPDSGRHHSCWIRWRECPRQPRNAAHDLLCLPSVPFFTEPASIPQQSCTSMWFSRPIFLASLWSFDPSSVHLILHLIPKVDSRTFLTKDRPMRGPVGPSLEQRGKIFSASWILVVRNMRAFKLLVAISLLCVKSLSENGAITLVENTDPVVLKTLDFFSYMRP